MVGVLIITYNSRDVIGPCLDSCLALGGCEILVIDNASTDGTQSEILARPAARAFLNSENRGYAAAVNQGVAALSTPFVLLLNPDTRVMRGIKNLRRHFDDPQIGAVAGRLVDRDGNAQSAFQLRRLPSPAALAFEALGVNRIYPANPVNRHYRPSDPEREFEQPAAAFLMIRRSAWDAVGGLDERFYPVWFEDVDFCKRLREAGWCVAYEGEAVAAHVGGHSAQQLEWGAKQVFWYGSLLRYASKHFTAASRRIVCFAVMLACSPRTIAGIFTRRSFEPVPVYSKVFWLAAWCFIFGGIEAQAVVENSRQHVGRGANAAG
jgi:N-acetylglucosaminyl-diphospho-decaprenol L-rhamnosyltransferase